MTLNGFSQCSHQHFQNKNDSIKKDSLIRVVDFFKRENGTGEAIIIQRHRNDPAADKMVNEYIRKIKNKYIEKSRNNSNTLREIESSGCSNLDFENGNFTNWTCQTGVNNGYPASGWGGTAPVANRHTIVTGGADPYGGFPMLAPNGGAYSVKLGNDDINYEAEQLIYTFTVQPQDTNFIYKYAVVLEDPGTSHLLSEKPYFELKILDGGWFEYNPLQLSAIYCRRDYPWFFGTGSRRNYRCDLL